MIPLRHARFVPLGLLTGLLVWHLLRLNIIGVPGLSNSSNGQRYVQFSAYGTSNDDQLGRLISQLTMLHATAQTADRIAAFASFNANRSWLLRSEWPWRRPLVPLPAIIGISPATGTTRGWASSDHFFNVCSFPKRVRFSPKAGITFGGIAALLKDDPSQCILITNDLFAERLDHDLASDASHYFKTIATLTLSKLRWSRHVYETVASTTAKDDFLVGTEIGREAPYLAVEIPRPGLDPDCAAMQEHMKPPYGFNSLDSLAKHWPPGDEAGRMTADVFVPRCLPSIDNMAEKIRNYGWQHQLKRLVIVHRLSPDEYAALKKGVEWAFDKVLELGQVEVAYPKERPRRAWGFFEGPEASWQAEADLIKGAAGIDMAVRASAFIGNGWSSTTSLIVGTRLAKARERGVDNAAKSISFW